MKARTNTKILLSIPGNTLNQVDLHVIQSKIKDPRATRTRFINCAIRSALRKLKPDVDLFTYEQIRRSENKRKNMIDNVVNL